MNGPPTTDRVRVVLVDDSDIYRTGMARAINADPRLVLVGQAAGGVEGLVIARRTMPHVVLSDIRMADLDGLALCRALKEDRGADVVVILMSVNEATACADQVREAGADAFIGKSESRRRMCDGIAEHGGTPGEVLT